MICRPYASVKRKAERLFKLIGKLKTGNFALELADGSSRPGGGALPLLELPSRLLRLVPGKLSPQFMEAWFRCYATPVITRVEREMVLLDLRTVQEGELKTVARAIRELSVL